MPSYQEQNVEIAVLKTQMDAVQKSLERIETNHLLHINDELRRINEKVDSKITDLVKNMESRLANLSVAVESLKVTDAKQEPNNHLVSKIIEFVLLAVVSAGVSFLVVHGSR